ncbi:hypothetical protein JW796_03000 [Candidatus Dojkabacteria bacterium]|nr:hypothetical protein [Candidatus Dojkabacteria bacterium]
MGNGNTSNREPYARYGLPTDKEIISRLRADIADPQESVKSEEYYYSGKPRFDEFWWWYIDGRKLDVIDSEGKQVPVEDNDQRFILVTFYNNNVLSASLLGKLPEWIKRILTPLIKHKPKLSVEVHLPGIDIKREYIFNKGENTFFSTDDIDIQLGSNYLRTVDGDIRHVQAEIEVPENDIKIFLDLDSREIGLPPHRENTGYYVFGHNANKVLSWKQFQPYSKVTGHYIHQGKRYEVTGEGYGDHASGNELFAWNLWHWYSFMVGDQNNGEDPIYFLGGLNIAKDGSFVKTLIFGTSNKVIGTDPKRWEIKPISEYYDPEFHRWRIKEQELRYIDEENHLHLFKVVDAETMRVDPVLVMTAVSDNNPSWYNKLIEKIANKTWNTFGAYLKYKPEVEYYEFDSEGKEINHLKGTGVNENFYPGTKHFPIDKPPYTNTKEA